MEILDKINSLFRVSFINTLLTVICVYAILKIAKRYIDRFIEAKFKEKEFILKKIEKIVGYVIFVLIVCYEFTPLSSITTTLVASTGIAAIVIGLASQEVAGDILDGCMIYLTKPYAVGDFIYVQTLGVKGTVKDIRLRHTVLETLDKTTLVIPNSSMNSGVIENFSLSEEHPYKMNYIYFDISYESDIEKAMQIIKEEAMQIDDYVDMRSEEQKAAGVESVTVMVWEMKDSGIQLRAALYSVDCAKEKKQASDLMLRVKKAFGEQGIDFPYPHMHIVQ